MIHSCGSCIHKTTCKIQEDLHIFITQHWIHLVPKIEDVKITSKEWYELLAKKCVEFKEKI